MQYVSGGVAVLKEMLCYTLLIMLRPSHYVTPFSLCYALLIMLHPSHYVTPFSLIV